MSVDKSTRQFSLFDIYRHIEYRGERILNLLSNFELVYEKPSNCFNKAVKPLIPSLNQEDISCLIPRFKSKRRNLILPTSIQYAETLTPTLIDQDNAEDISYNLKVLAAHEWILSETLMYSAGGLVGSKSLVQEKEKWTIRGPLRRTILEKLEKTISEFDTSYVPVIDLAREECEKEFKNADCKVPVQLIDNDKETEFNFNSPYEPHHNFRLLHESGLICWEGISDEVCNKILKERAYYGDFGKSEDMIPLEVRGQFAKGIESGLVMDFNGLFTLVDLLAVSRKAPPGYLVLEVEPMLKAQEEYLAGNDSFRWHQSAPLEVAGLYLERIIGKEKDLLERLSDDNLKKLRITRSTLIKEKLEKAFSNYGY